MSLRIDARDTILAVARRTVDGVRQVRCRLRESLPPIITGTKEASGKSVILLDGTADEAMTQAVFKYVAPINKVDVLAQPGAYTLTQCYDRTFAPTGLTKASGAHSDSNLYKLWRHIRKLAARAPLRSPLGADGAPDGGVFVACPLKVEVALKSLGFPENVFVRHYNDQRGVDIYRNVRYAVIISRSEKPEWVLEDLAETFYYDDPKATTSLTCRSTARFALAELTTTGPS